MPAFKPGQASEVAATSRITSYNVCYTKLLRTTTSGDAYTFRELEQMYTQAGYRRVTEHPVPTGPHTVVMGHLA